MREMKAKLLVILCVMIFVGAIMVGPVAAATDTGQTIITGNPEADIQVTANITATEIALVQGSENYNATLIVNVKANPFSWTLAVEDDMTGPKDVAAAGYMTNWTGIAWAVPTTKLLNPMKIQGSAETGATQESEKTVTNAPLTLETGYQATLTGGTNFVMTTHQKVEYGDQNLNTPNVYRLVFLFTGTTL